MKPMILKRPNSTQEGAIFNPLNDIQQKRVTTDAPIRGYQKREGEYVSLADQLYDERFNQYHLNHMRQAR